MQMYHVLYPLHSEGRVGWKVSGGIQQPSQGILIGARQLGRERAATSQCWLLWLTTTSFQSSLPVLIS